MATAVRRGSAAMRDQAVSWQSHVFSAGDFLAVWAVEDVVHQLDLQGDHPAPENAVRLTVATIEALVGRSLPADWGQEQSVLIGTGREPVPQDAQDLSAVLPAFS